MGRGLSEQQTHVLQILQSKESAVRHYFANTGVYMYASVDANKTAKTASASISRTLSRLVQRGLIEKMLFQFWSSKANKGRLD